VSLRVGVLVTNTDDSDFAHRHPKDGEKFAKLLNTVRPSWQIKIYQVKDGTFPNRSDECDGYVITGSPASVNAGDRWIEQLLQFIRALYSANLPTVGCCFGHQAIAKALGGEVTRSSKGWGFGVSPTHFTVNKSWMNPESQNLNLYAAHTEQVTRLPAGAEVLGGDNFCPIGSFAIGNTFFTTEYHPEMSSDFFSELVDEYESYIGKDVAERAREQAKTPVDSILFAEWMAKFLEMQR
jgi:GMP synthase-like glutamine amidotransferase